MRCAAASVVLLITVSACTGADRDVAAPTGIPELTPASATPRASSAPATESGATTPSASFVIALTDEEGLHPEGIPILIESPERHVVFTDARGEITLTRPATYRLRVQTGCHERVNVLGGGSATAGVAIASERRESLPVRWQHRYGPSAPVLPDQSEDWPVGANVKLRYDVIDRCTGKRAPTAVYPTFAFTHGSNLTVVGAPPLVADREGYGTVTVRCSAEGQPTLVLKDTKKPTDQLDLVASAVSYGGTPRCR